MKIKYIIPSLIMAMLIIYGCQKQNTDDIEPINTSGNDGSNVDP
jgi:hypothetical protein